MRNIKTKVVALTMAAVMATSLSACSIHITVNKGEDAPQQEDAVANPIKEVSQDELAADTGIDLPLPDEATDVTYSIIELPEYDIAQADFTLDGDEMYLRACFTDMTALNDQSADAKSYDTSAGDISGLNYKWNSFKSTDVQGREAMVSANKHGQGYIVWLDVVTGVLYNLCMEKNANPDKLEELAAKVFVPMQGDAEA